MAIDTAAKRRRASDAFRWWFVSPLPDGSIGDVDKAHVWGSYYAAGEAQVTPVRIRFLSRTTVDVSGGDRLTIYVKDASGSGNSVDIVDSAAQSRAATIVSESATAITITTPIGAAGDASVTVTTADAQTDTLGAAETGHLRYDSINDLSIPERITDNIQSTLQGVTEANGYDITVAAVEQERIIQQIDGRYPFVEIVGPLADVDNDSTQADEHSLEYTVTYYDEYVDMNPDTQEAAPKQAASVVSNLHRALMVDHTRGGLAVMTRLSEYGYANYVDERQMPVFVVYMTIRVQTLIDTFNMKSLV